MDYMDDAPQAVTFLVDNLHLREFNPINCGWHKREPLRRFGPAVREEYILHYVLSGKGTFSCEGEHYALTPQQIFLIRPGQLVTYQADAASPWTYAWIGFEGTAAERLLQAAGFVGNHRVAALPEMQDFFCSLQQRDHQSPLSGALLCARLFELLDILRGRQCPLPHRSMPELYTQQAVDYIRSNYSHAITVSGLADTLGIDRRYFSRIFTAVTGLSPQAYLLNYRMSRAAGLLAERRCTVGEAAQSVGYTDAFTFSRMYKRHYGLAPSDTRRCGEIPRQWAPPLPAAETTSTKEETDL